MDQPRKTKALVCPGWLYYNLQIYRSKTGGRFHYHMHDPKHGGCWVIGTYLEILKPEKLVFTMRFSNENGDITDESTGGMVAQWPGDILTTVTFESIGNQTKATIHETVSEEDARKTGAYQGWINMFDRLNRLLTTGKN